MKISFLVAVSLNQVIGIDNKLPWHLPADLKFFKNLTTGHTIVMGRKTFDSIGKPLPNRENIVITHSKEFKADGLVIKNSIEETLEYCKEKGEVFVIGGEVIFKQMMDIVQTIYLTVVHTCIENGDAFFPKLDLKCWKLIKSDFHEKDEKNKFDYTFETYERI